MTSSDFLDHVYIVIPRGNFFKIDLVNEKICSEKYTIFKGK
jgi:hypothetical protein